MNNNQQKKITIQDVAALSGVSVATVSRTLSKPGKVSDKTYQNVMAVVEKTGYSINESARNLRRQQTDTILILLPNIGNPVFSNVVEGIEKVCAESDVSVMIADTQKASELPFNNKGRRHFSQNQVDGMIVLDGLVPVELLYSKHNPLPIVFAGEWYPDTEFPVVCIDDIQGVKLVAEHLYALGHRCIGQVTGALSHTPGKVRYDAFYQALNVQDQDLVKNHWFFEGDFSLSSGSLAAKAWFNLPKNKRPSAVFCAGDGMALGFIFGLHKLGVNVPDDVSVVGYDDLRFAEYAIPALTTVHQPFREMGKLAAKTLLAILKNEPYERLQVIGTRLVVRDSTKKWSNEH